MKIKVGRIVIPVLVVLILIILQLLSAKSAENSMPFVKSGILNLDEWNEDKCFQLAGEYEFYWDQLLSIDQIIKENPSYYLEYFPSTWNYYNIYDEYLPRLGKATYRIHVVGADTNTEYSISLQNMTTSYKLYVDSTILLQNGNFQDDDNAPVSEYIYRTVSFTPNSSEFDIILQISNNSIFTSGMWEPILFGKSNQINSINSFLSNINNISIAIIIFICILFLIIFSAQRHEKDLIILVGFGLIVLIRLLIFPYSELSFAKFTPNMSVSTLLRLDYFTTIWMPFLIIYFVYTTYGTYIKRWHLLIALCYSLLLSALLILPSRLILPLDNFIFSIVYISVFFAAIHLAIAAWHNEEGAPFFFGVLVFYILYILYYSLISDYSISYFLIMSPAFAVLVLFIAQFINVAHRYSKVQKLEMSAYKNQIHPHFFNNSLAGIISIARTDPAKSRELLLDMSSYLHGFYDYLDDDFITLSQELELVNSYVMLNKMRFGDLVKVNYELKVSNLMLPPLILEPLVENAFIHGLREKEGDGEIFIYTEKVKGGMVRIGVKDNGVGLEKKQNNPDSRQGVGIKNINLRLRRLYRTQLIYETPEEGGCNVYMEIPLKETAANENISC